MCGRFVQMSPPEVYAGMFGAEPLLQMAPRYNLAPSQQVLAARGDSAGGAELVLLRWGLVPHWSKGPDNRFSMINARAETVHEKPAYRGPFRYHRCLIPAEGFYEWQPGAGGKQPYFIHGAEQRPFAMAGVWDRWQDGEGNELQSCSIIVVDADPTLAAIHDRMPLILAPEQYSPWLDPSNQDSAAIRKLMQPSSALFRFQPVSKRVNNPANDDAALLDPVG